MLPSCTVKALVWAYCEVAIADVVPPTLLASEIVVQGHGANSSRSTVASGGGSPHDVIGFLKLLFWLVGMPSPMKKGRISIAPVRAWHGGVRKRPFFTACDVYFSMRIP